MIIIEKSYKSIDDLNGSWSVERSRDLANDIVLNRAMGKCILYVSPDAASYLQMGGFLYYDPANHKVEDDSYFVGNMIHYIDEKIFIKDIPVRVHPFKKDIWYAFEV